MQQLLLNPWTCIQATAAAATVLIEAMGNHQITASQYVSATDMGTHAAGYLVQLPCHLLAVWCRLHVQLLCLPRFLGPGGSPAL